MLLEFLHWPQKRSWVTWILSGAKVSDSCTLIFVAKRCEEIGPNGWIEPNSSDFLILCSCLLSLHAFGAKKVVKRLEDPWTGWKFPCLWHSQTVGQAIISSKPSDFKPVPRVKPWQVGHSHDERADIFHCWEVAVHLEAVSLLSRLKSTIQTRTGELRLNCFAGEDLVKGGHRLIRPRPVALLPLLVWPQKKSGTFFTHVNKANVFGELRIHQRLSFIWNTKHDSIWSSAILSKHVSTSTS